MLSQAGCRIYEKKAFNKIDQLELPAIERVKFHRWNLGDGTITESEASANVPDFTALDSNLKLVQLELRLYLNRCHKPWQTKEFFLQISILPRRNSAGDGRLLHVFS